MVLALSFASCSHKKVDQRTPASTADIGLTGDGAVLLFYRSGDNVVIRKCDPLTVLGSNPSEAQAACKGAENQVPVKVFKRTLRKVISGSNSKLLSPLSEASVASYERDQMYDLDIDAIMTRFEKLKAFAKANPGEVTNAQKEELEQHRVVSEVEDVVNKVLELISNKAELTQKNKSENQYEALYTALNAYNPAIIKPCG